MQFKDAFRDITEEEFVSLEPYYLKSFTESQFSTFMDALALGINDPKHYIKGMTYSGVTKLIKGERKSGKTSASKLGWYNDNNVYGYFNRSRTNKDAYSVLIKTINLPNRIKNNIENLTSKSRWHTLTFDEAEVEALKSANKAFNDELRKLSIIFNSNNSLKKNLQIFELMFGGKYNFSNEDYIIEIYNGKTYTLSDLYKHDSYEYSDEPLYKLHINKIIEWILSGYNKVYINQKGWTFESKGYGTKYSRDYQEDLKEIISYYDEITNLIKKLLDNGDLEKYNVNELNALEQSALCFMIALNMGSFEYDLDCIKFKRNNDWIKIYELS